MHPYSIVSLSIFLLYKYEYITCLVLKTIQPTSNPLYTTAMVATGLFSFMFMSRGLPTRHSGFIANINKSTMRCGLETKRTDKNFVSNSRVLKA